MHPPDAPAPLAAEQVLSGRYRMVSPIARGGMAEVWEAYDQVLSRPVAIKVLQRQYASDEVFLERFRREAVAAARLAHPGVVATFDAGADGPTTYMVMELVRGRTLRERLAAQGVFPPPLAMWLAYQIADALVHAHRAGIIHRDIKPANILLLEDGDEDVRVKVADFGIAKAAEGLGLDLTNTGMVLGTPRYLSPEQVEGIEPDARADLYALGVMCFEMLTGRSPFGGETEMAMAIARLNRAAPRVRDLQPKVPGYVDAVVADLLATDPLRRTPSALVLRQKLVEVRQRLESPGVSEGGLLPRAGVLGTRWRARRESQNGGRHTPEPAQMPSRPPGPVINGAVGGPAFTGTRLDDPLPGASPQASREPAPRFPPGRADPPTPPAGGRVEGPVDLRLADPSRQPTNHDRPSPSAPPGEPASAAPGPAAGQPASAAPGPGPRQPASAAPGPAPAPVPSQLVPPRSTPAQPPAVAPRPSVGSPVSATGSAPWPSTSPPNGGPPSRASLPQPPIAPPRRPAPSVPAGAGPAAIPDYGVPHHTTGQERQPSLTPAARRPGRGPGVVVAALVVVALIVAALLLGSGHRNGSPTAKGGTPAPIPISSVAVWIVYPQSTPDNPSEVGNAYDANPKTQWESVHYRNPAFGGLSGEGLAIHLRTGASLHQLRVTSYTHGWAASTYVSNSEAPTLAGWGPPTDTQSNLPGNATFNLSGHQGSWVLLYMTNTGPSDQIGIAELAVN